MLILLKFVFHANNKILSGGIIQMGNSSHIDYFCGKF